MNLINIVALEGQVVFDLPFTYTPGANELFVFWQGQLQYVGISYVETSPTRVTLLFSANAGHEFVFRIPPGTFAGFSAPTTFTFASRLPKPVAAPVLLFS